MANPQKENGYTPIANEILENISKFDFTAIQFKILMIVWRYSYGFQKKDCQLSLTDFANLIGSDKPYLSRQIKKLIEINALIECQKAEFMGTRILRFNKNYEEWRCTRVQQLHKDTTVVPEYNTTVVPEYNTTVVLEYNPTYKENFKENIKETYSWSNYENEQKNDVVDKQKIKQEKAQKIKEELEMKFNEFWKSYPKKVGKPVALKSWLKIKPDENLFSEIMQALENHKKLDQWRRDNGQYIPNPSTWLNQKRWEDEINGTVSDTAGDSGDDEDPWSRLENRYELFGFTDDEN